MSVCVVVCLFVCLRLCVCVFVCFCVCLFVCALVGVSTWTKQGWQPANTPTVRVQSEYSQSTFRVQSEYIQSTVFTALPVYLLKRP